MTTDFPDIANDQSRVVALRAAIDRLPGPVFAVVDGSHFDDIEDELADLGIASRSLFLRGGDDGMRRDGPWLVALKDRAARQHIEELALTKPSVVFWSCPEGEQVLWRHLRGINQILVPDSRLPDTIEYERVLFRHWDPNALAPVLRLFDVEQFARIFGPAEAIIMNADGGLTLATKPEGLVKVRNSTLTIRPDQFEALDANSRDAYCRRMSAILREMAPEETAGMSDEALNQRVLRYEASGNRLGLGQERSLSIWGYLMITSDDQFENLPNVTNYIRSGPETPDQNVETLLQQMTRLAGTVSEVY